MSRAASVSSRRRWAASALLEAQFSRFELTCHWCQWAPVVASRVRVLFAYRRSDAFEAGSAHDQAQDCALLASEAILGRTTPQHARDAPPESGQLPGPVV